MITTKRYYVALEGNRLGSRERDQVGKGQRKLRAAVRRAEAEKAWYPDKPIKVIDFGPDRPRVVYIARGVYDNKASA